LGLLLWSESPGSLETEKKVTHPAACACVLGARSGVGVDNFKGWPFKYKKGNGVKCLKWFNRFGQFLVGHGHFRVFNGQKSIEFLVKLGHGAGCSRPKTGG
jgi:hypothetical protein